MRVIFKLLAASAILLLMTKATACKVLTNYPDHLDISEADVTKYYVVSVLKELPHGYEGEIKMAFGGQLLVGNKVFIQFRTNEETHAICPNELKERESYLLRSDGLTPWITISRYDWLNIPISHEKYLNYVQDITVRSSH